MFLDPFIILQFEIKLQYIGQFIGMKACKSKATN